MRLFLALPALMLGVAVTSFWIKSSGSFSWIHVLSVTVIVLVGVLIYFAVTRQIGAHRRLAAGLYAGALGITGMFTLLPYRLLGRMVWAPLGLL